MTTIQYDDDLLEAAVFRRAANRSHVPSLQAARFHREREKLYAVLDPDERNAAFFRLHADWFREWGMESTLRKILGDFPLLERHLDGLVFRRARTRNDEGAELFVSTEQGRHGIIALRPERFEAEDSLRPFLNHEFTHVSDMVDPAFGYSPRLEVPTGVRAHERLVRERYRLLWDVTIDGRLHRRERSTEATREKRSSEFVRAFAFREDHSQIFDDLWNARQPSHTQLTMLACDPRRLAHSEEAGPGALCPLCGFSTFEWANLELVSDVTIAVIQREFPSWQRNDAACARCVEVYDAVRMHASVAQ